MKIPTVKVVMDTTWKRALNKARRTIGKEPLDKEPSEEWKKRAIMAEHSPIKLVEYDIQFKDLRQWIGVHFLRHEHTLPFIHSQRGDRDKARMQEAVENVLAILKEDIINDPEFNARDYRFQGEPNDQDFVVNAQTLINISRKRLCKCASKETREAWQLVKNAIAEIDPTMAGFMVKNCVYRGRCPEWETCGFYKTQRFKKEVDNYWKQIGR